MQEGVGFAGFGQVIELAVTLGLIEQGIGAMEDIRNIAEQNASSSEEIAAADAAIGKIETAQGLPRGSIKLHAMIESAAGILHAAEIASASPRMASLIFGSADYAANVHCRPGEDRREVLLALQTGQLRLAGGQVLQRRGQALACPMRTRSSSAP